MTHDLRQAVQRDGLGHPVTKAVTQIVRAHIDEFGCISVLFDNVAKRTFRQSPFVLPVKG
jgi:hypothetical protein